MRVYRPGMQSANTVPKNPRCQENAVLTGVKVWRKRVGVEPTGDRIARHPPVLKTGTITGPHALPLRPWKRPRTGGASRVELAPIRGDPCKLAAPFLFWRAGPQGLKPRMS
jgi:hypothetical protein